MFAGRPAEAAGAAAAAAEKEAAATAAARAVARKGILAAERLALSTRASRFNSEVVWW